MKNYILKDKKLSIISRVSILIIWVLLSLLVNNEVVIPSVTSTFTSMIKIIKEVNFLTIVYFTIVRTIIGFIISLFLAVLTGVLSSVSKLVYNFMLPILELLNSLPTIGIIVLALIWLNNEWVPMFVGFIMVFPILYESIINSILNTDEKILEMAQLYRVDKVEIIKSIYIPNILYDLSGIFNSAIGVNLKMVIAGEVLSQPKYAIGSSIQLQRMYLNTSGVFAWLILILLISAIFDYIGKVIKYSLGIKRWK